MIDDIFEGTTANDGTGTSLRDGGLIIDANFVAISNKRSIVAAGALSAGDPVNLHVVTGVLTMRKADATDTTKPADGIVPAAVADTVAGVFLGLGVTLSGFPAATFTMGSTYWLAVGGGLTATMPSTTLNGQQPIGIAVSDTELMTYRAAMNEAP